MLITIKNIIGSIRNVLGIVTEGLKMWLPFERTEIVSSTQVAPDTSGNSNNATLYTGKSLSFDGVNDYVDCGNIGVSLKTLAFWINLYSTTEKVLQVTSSQSVEVSSGTITLNGTWTGSTIYVDATATSTIVASSYKRVVITTTSAITVDDLELGRIGSSYGDFILSDLEIYDTPWTQADVTYDYNKPNHLVTDNPSTSIALSNLKGYWALSEGDGSIAYDSSGEGNNGTINGATYEDAQPTIPQLGMMDWAKSTPVSDEITLVANPNNPSQDILGNSVRLREHSFNLDGLGYADVADDSSLDFGTGDFTLECWAKYDFLNQGSSWNVLVSNGSISGGGSGFNLASSASSFSIRLNAGTAVTKTFGTDNMTVGNWYHLVVTREGTLLKTYRDTSLKSSSTIISVDVDTSFPVKIGRDTLTTRFYQNLIDDVRLYNKALSADEIEQNYNAGLSQHKVGSSFSDDFSGDYGN